MHKTGEVVTMQFCVSDPATGGLVNADAPGPTGTLIVNGVADAATVTVTAISTGVYSASVTLPTITDGDELQIRIAATVAAVAGGGIVWSGVGCTKRPADVAADVASALAPLAVLVTDWTDGGRLDLLLDAAAGGAGGSYAQTVTVTCGGVAVPNATVEILSGTVTIDRQTTNSSGVATPTCNAGIYSLVVTCNGYASSTSTIMVTVAASHAVTLTAISITVSSPGKTTLYGNVYDKDLNGKDGTAVTCSINKLPSGDTGRILDSEDKSDTTDASGYFEFTNCLQGATYVVVCGRHRKEVVVGTSGTQGIGSFIK